MGNICMAASVRGGSAAFEDPASARPRRPDSRNARARDRITRTTPQATRTNQLLDRWREPRGRGDTIGHFRQRGLELFHGDLGGLGRCGGLLQARGDLTLEL